MSCNCSSKNNCKSCDPYNFSVYVNENYKRVYRLPDGIDFSGEASIKVSNRLNGRLVKEYAIGEGLEVIDGYLVWSLTPSEFNERKGYYEAMLVSVLENKVDFSGEIEVKQRIH